MLPVPRQATRHRTRGRARRLLCVPAAAAYFALAGAAHGQIDVPTVVAGPSPSILGVGNVAMAPDGSGGIVWRQIEDGQPHILVSRYQYGSWSAPIQADVGQPGPATFPTIAAADNGELLAVWVEPYASVSTNGGTPTTIYDLYSAILPPGSRTFMPAVQVDPGNVASGTGVDPSLAMTPTGQAYVAYRVITNPLTPNVTQPPGTLTPFRPGDVIAQIRVARLSGLTWSALGVMNVYPNEVTMRSPQPSNAPVVGITPGGQGVVAWQEPTIDGTARIWARRLFGSTVADAQQISPPTINNLPVTADADAPAVAVGANANAAVIFRLAGGPGSPLGQPTEMLATIGTSTDPQNGAAFTTAAAVVTAPTVGIPSVSTGPLGGFQSAFDVGGEAEVAAGTAAGSGNPASPLGASTGDAVTALEPGGGGTVAWPGTDGSGKPAVQVQETYPGGDVQSASLSAPISGPLASLTLAPSGAGDALVGFEQGTSGTTQVAADEIRVPPHPFVIQGPDSWVTPAHANVYWTLARTAGGGVTYSVVMDGRTLVTGLGVRHFTIPAAALGSGVHTVQVIATDPDAQQTITTTHRLMVDGSPPVVSAQRKGDHVIVVTVTDGFSGVRTGATRISFGAGTATVHGHRKAVHTYRQRGVYRITVRAVSNVGVGAVDHFLVRVG